MTRDEFAAYLDSARITGDVATPRENNLSHIQGFLDHNSTSNSGLHGRRIGPMTKFLRSWYAVLD